MTQTIGAAALRERQLGLRMREAEHRIKNHLQLVASGLALEARRCTNNEARGILLQAGGRIAAVARLHEHLMRAQDGAEVEMKAFLTDFCADLRDSFEAAGAPEVHVEMLIEPHRLPVRRALAVGAIVSELVTNAVKHGATEQGCHVVVRLSGDAERGCLTVSDDGKGIDAEDVLRGQSVGFQILRALAGEAGGRIVVDRTTRGASLTVCFGDS